MRMQKSFLLLGPIVCFAGDCKLTQGMKPFMQFKIHQQQARKSLSNLKVVSLSQFNDINWKIVHVILEGVH